MYLATLRRNVMISPLAAVVALLLAASPAMAQPTTGEGDSHASPADDPAMSTPAPPVMENAAAPVEVLWFYVKAGTKAGPVSTVGLRTLVMNGSVKSGAKVWKKGMSGWLPMSTLPEFSDLTPPPPPPDPAAQAAASLTAEPEPERIKRKGMVISGGLVFGVTWLAAIVSSIFASEETDYDYVSGTQETPEEHTKYAQIAWIPVVGPVAGYAGAGGDDNRVIAIMTIWSLAQATGLGLFIAGMVGKKNPKYKGEAAGIQLTPMVGNLNGLGLTGRF